MGGKNRLPMATLRALFEVAGCTDVETYIQSGNVVFGCPAAQLRALPETIAAALEDACGFTVPVVVRTGAELAKAVQTNPFATAGGNCDPTRVHVGFMAAKPTRAAVAALDPYRSPPDRFAVVGQEIHLCCPNGMARTRLTSPYLDATLRTVVTIRNWKTTLRLREMVLG